jgi:hypothetical protein
LKSQVGIEGPSKFYIRDVQQRRTISFHFCPECGSSPFWHLDLRPDHIGIAVDAFADPEFPPATVSLRQRTEIPAGAARLAGGNMIND